MPTINDYKKKALNDAGYSGDISTAEWKWLKDICYPYVGAIPDMWRYALRQMGFSGSLIDAQSAMLKDLGYTDFSMNDKWYKYWRDTPLEGTTWWKVGSALDLDFANSRGFNSADRDKTTPDSILTYANPSAKMVYGSDGVLRYAPHNLLLQSQTFETASWAKVRVTVTANAVAAPDGTVTADTLSEDGTAATSHVATQSFSYTSGTTYTFSIFVKKANRDWFIYQLPSAAFGGSATERTVSFNVNTGAIGTPGASFTSSSIQSVGNGWYRCIATATANATASSVLQVIIGEADGDFIFNGLSQASLYIWGAQISQGVTLFTYIPTTTAAVYSLPIDHNPTTLEPLGVLIEEQRTNLLTYSEQFDNAAWTRGNIAAFGSGSIANAIAAPDGTTTADKIVEAATTATHNMAQNATIVSATVYTYSVYAKAAERSWICLEGGGGGGGFSVWFNLATGAVGTISGTTAGNVSIVALPNGWYRCIVTDTSTSTSGTYRYFICDADNNQSYTGDGTSGLYFWGAQLEAGAFATSYIHTTNNPLGVTRLADQVSISTSAFAYNAAAGTMVAEVRAANLSVSRRIAVLYNDASNRIALNLDNGSQLFVRTLGSTVASVDGGTFTVGQSDKVAVAFTTDDYVATVNGAAVGVDPDGGAMPSGITVLQVGNQASIEQTNGHIKRLTYFPTRKTDAELQALAA